MVLEYNFKRTLTEAKTRPSSLPETHTEPKQMPFLWRIVFVRYSWAGVGVCKTTQLAPESKILALVVIRAGE